MMIDFNCVQLHDDGEGYESWPGRANILKRTPPYEVQVESRGSCFYIIFGECTRGHYICIPAWDVGCALSTYQDVYWNTEKLSRRLSPVDASSVASAISSVAEVLKT